MDFWLEFDFGFGANEGQIGFGSCLECCGEVCWCGGNLGLECKLLCFLMVCWMLVLPYLLLDFG
jgi:hypothetical protein